jgi:septum site-determining protein MinD
MADGAATAGMHGADADLVAVAGGKGGCGKTTTTLGLALAAARLGGTVLAVDADLDVPDLHRMAGVDGADGGPLHPRSVPGTPGAAVLPARPGADPCGLAERLPALDRYDLVLLDCPAGAGRDVAHPLGAADSALVVATAAPAALEDAAKTAAMARAVDATVAGAVVTGTDSPPTGTERLLGTRVVETVPAVDSPLSAPTARRSYTEVVRRLPTPERPKPF